MQLAALEQRMLIYIGLLYVNCKVVKVRILAGLSVLHTFCVITFVCSKGCYQPAPSEKIEFQNVKIEGQSS